MKQEVQEKELGSPQRMVQFGYRRVPENEKVEWVSKHFNTVAEKYDFMNSLLSFGIHHLWKRVAVKKLALNPGDRVIDVCGGTGDLAILARKVVGSSGRLVVYDINQSMMKKGMEKVSRSYAANGILWTLGDAEEISFRTSSFDAAMVGFGIRNLTHMERGFEEMYRVLKPGGKLVCLEFSRPPAPMFRWLYDFYSFHIMPFLGQLFVGSRRAYAYLPESIRLFPLPDELNNILTETGFSNVTYFSLTNGIAVIHLAEKR